MSPASAQPRSGVLLVFGLVMLLALFALYAVMVHTEGGQDLDANAYAGPLLEPSVGNDFAEALLQTITVGSMALAAIVIAGIGLARGGWPVAGLALAVVAGSLFTTEVLKHVILDRPDLIGTGDTKNTFPSGHTTVAISLGIAALIAVPAWMRPAALIGAIALASVVGVATVVGGWHRPSDVLGAYLVTVGVGAVLAAAVPKALTAPPEPGDEHADFGVHRAVALGAVLGILAVFAIGIADNASEIDWSAVDRGVLASAVALPAAATVLILGFAAAFFGFGGNRQPA